ncbi:hypothetical protein CL621_01330 [archaeon]|nr:hypothetical protein [archaeon]|tara:strand:- start:422 stop:886 length:465 start_codon:yes stop_codon:yes gene_type:complete
MFSFKKKKPKIPNLSKFPDIPKESKLPKFPAYGTPKRQDVPSLPPQESDFEIPKREPLMRQQPITAAPTFEEGTPISRPELQGKPVYVKMEEYKKILNALDAVKNKINKAEETLLSIERFKEREDMELRKWKEEVNRIKENLIMVERKLSGSQI